MKSKSSKCIPPDQLKVGKAYWGQGRNFNVGIWTGKVFFGVRHKYNQHFMDEELHWDLDDHHGTFQPFEELSPTSEEIHL